ELRVADAALFTGGDPAGGAPRVRACAGMRPRALPPQRGGSVEQGSRLRLVLDAPALGPEAGRGTGALPLRPDAHGPQQVRSRLDHDLSHSPGAHRRQVPGRAEPGALGDRQGVHRQDVPSTVDRCPVLMGTSDYAIVIGIERYDDPGLGVLKGPGRDARRFCEWVTDPGGG